MCIFKHYRMMSLSELAAIAPGHVAILENEPLENLFLQVGDQITKIKGLAIENGLSIDEAGALVGPAEHPLIQEGNIKIQLYTLLLNEKKNRENPSKPQVEKKILKHPLTRLVRRVRPDQISNKPRAT